MTDIALSHREALAATGRIVDGITPAQWSAPTPCAEWTVRDLLNHLVSDNHWAAELAAGATIAEVGDRLEGDLLGPDPAGAYHRSAEAAAAVFERPDALTAPCAVSYGPVPGEVYAGHRFLDVLIHGWDLAVATGRPRELDPKHVEAAWAVVEPQAAELRASGMFGEPVPVTGDADQQTRLLAALGRHPEDRPRRG